MDANELHEAYIRQLRAVGESLILNARSIVGNEKYLRSLYISFDLDPEIEIPEINISKGFVPERYFEERYKNGE